MPILVNVLVRDAASARSAATGSLELHACERCGFVWNAAFVGATYDTRYHIDPSGSPRFRRHADWLADRVAAMPPTDRALTLVEVGAGQGRFLDHLARRRPDRIGTAFGFDPAYRAGEVALAASIRMQATVLDASASVGVEPDVVISRHVVEHLADPVAFLASLRHAFGAEARFGIVVETPNVERSLERGLLHDFYYEHCSLFGPRALRAALERAGYVDVAVDDAAYDGEYLVATGRTAPERGARVEATDASAPVRPRLADIARAFVPRHRERLRAARALGPVVVWGGAGKGAFFTLLADPECTLVDAVVDIDPQKQGCFLPGSGHRVIGPDAARALAPRTIVVSNATYRDEIARAAAELGLDAALFCVGDDA